MHRHGNTSLHPFRSRELKELLHARAENFPIRPDELIDPSVRTDGAHEMAINIFPADEYRTFRLIGANQFQIDAVRGGMNPCHGQSCFRQEPDFLQQGNQFPFDKMPDSLFDVQNSRLLALGAAFVF